MKIKGFYKLVGTLVLIAFGIACDSERESKRVGGKEPEEQFEPVSENATVKKTKISYSFEGLLADNKLFTNERNHSLGLSWKALDDNNNPLPEVSSSSIGQGLLDQGYELRLDIFDSKGELVLSEKLTEKFDLAKFSLTDAEDRYTLKVVVEKSSKDGTYELQQTSDEFFVFLDLTPPVFSGNFDVAINSESSEKSAFLKLKADDKSPVFCESAKIVSTQTDAEVASVDVDGTAELAEGALSVDKLSLGNEIAGPFLFQAKCFDAAKNPSEFILPANMEAVPLTYEVKAGVEIKTPIGLELGHYILNDFELPIQINILDKTTLKKVAETVWQEQNKGVLVDISTVQKTEFKGLQEQGQGTILRAPLSESINLTLPNNLDQANSLFVSLLLPREDGTYDLIEGHELKVFIDQEGPEATVLDSENYNAITKDQLVEVRLNVKNKGVKIASVNLELTQDEKTPVALNIVESTLVSDSEDQEAIFKFTFPLEKPQGFKYRAIIVDEAQNVFTTTWSPNLGGRYDLQYNSAETCNQAVNVAELGSKLIGQLGSNFYCNSPNQSQPLIPIVLSNHSEVPISLYETEFILGGLGYKIYVDDTEVFAGKIYDKNLIGSLTAGKTAIYNLAIDLNWLQGNKIELEFDSEASGALSTTNACYDIPDRPRITIQDQDLGFALQVSAYHSCQ